MTINALEFDEQPSGFDPSAEIAIDVLAADLGDAFSREDIIRHAAAWEAVNQRPLKLPIEMESWADYAKRKRKFIAVRPYIADAVTLSEDVGRLLRMDEPEDAAALTTHHDRIHDLEDALGRHRTDFTKPKVAPEDIDAASVRRFKFITDIETWSDRITAVGKEKDVGALNLVSARDLRPEVRAAATKRLLELQIK